MLQQDCSDLFIKNLSFWEQLSDEEKHLLCDHTMPVKYAKGASVHGGGDDCIGILLVKSGQLRTYIMSEDGRDVTLYRLFESDVCILSASCVLEAITFDVFIDAEEDTDVLLINSVIFHQLADQNIYVKCFGYQLATTRFSDVMWAMQQVLFMSADKRLAIFLTDELAKSGGDEIKLTHEQIARYMGSAREVVSRMLKYFAQEGIVALSRGGLKVIDKARLRRLAQ
ncbi:MAG: putative transcriptional regulator [Oscillospiraceae bacterium]|jgi:CRP/FNR family transcriptional regulator|nr:putative transcriptional regulator [Oscillospiraceae bacterium]